jgi:hypothetical protein
MDQSIISGLSAVLGSLVGGASTIATALVTHRAQSKRESINAEIRRRELVYIEFINESSKLAIEALNRTLDKPETLMNVYALLNRIRLTSSDLVIDAADRTINNIMGQYSQPNLSIEEIREFHASDHQDPLKEFSVCCKQELRRLSRGS